MLPSGVRLSRATLKLPVRRPYESISAFVSPDRLTSGFVYLTRTAAPGAMSRASRSSTVSLRLRAASTATGLPFSVTWKYPGRTWHVATIGRSNTSGTRLASANERDRAGSGRRCAPRRS